MSHLAEHKRIKSNDCFIAHSHIGLRRSRLLGLQRVTDEETI